MDQSIKSQFIAQWKFIKSAISARQFCDQLIGFPERPVFTEAATKIDEMIKEMEKESTDVAVVEKLLEELSILKDKI